MKFWDTIKIYYQFTREHHLMLALIMVGTLISSFAAAYLPVSWGQVVQSISDQNQSKLVQTGLVTTMIMLVGGGVFAIITRLSASVGAQIIEKARNTITKNLLMQSFEYHSNKSTGKIVADFSKTVGVIYEVFFGVYVIIAGSLVTLIISSVLLFSVSATIGILFGIIIIFVVILTLRVYKLNLSQKRVTEVADSEVNHHFVQLMQAFDVVKTSGQEYNETIKFNSLSKYFTKTEQNYQKTFVFVDLISLGTGLLFFIPTIWLIYSQFSIGSITAAMVTTIAGYSLKFSDNLRDIIFNIRNPIKNWPKIERIAEYIVLPKSETNHNYTQTILSPTGSITLSRLNFAYSSEQTLSNLNLIILAKTKLAIVGPSGGGKSTLIKLLLRLYNPTSGSIEYDDVSLDTLAESQLRSLVGIVPQDPMMFNDTIEFNLSYGLDFVPTKEQLDQASSNAQIDTFILNLPEGYQTMVGERGIKLSGGQKQRIAIARLFLKDPKIVIFDEATSMLDSENEQAIHIAFNKLAQNKTTIIIAHRLSTIIHCDSIVVLDKGKIIEQGTHIELLKQKGVYNNLWSIQSSGFIA
jgi:ABC-type multidrug transport system fused ATPase/permease subunit